MVNGKAADIAAAAIFLLAYLVYFIILLKLYLQRRIQWKSRYSFLMFHVTLRLVGKLVLPLGTGLPYRSTFQLTLAHLTGMALGITFSSMSWAKFEQRINGESCAPRARFSRSPAPAERPTLFFGTGSPALLQS
jgi:cytochrome c oxidase assembly factor CtaG